MATEYSNMTKNMAEEMEKRQKEWQKEVEKMQQNFFKSVTVDQPLSADAVRKSNLSPLSYTERRDDVVHSAPVTREFFEGIQRLPDGTPVFRARFDVRGFDPGEVSVRVAQVFDDPGKPSYKLIVSASHVEDVVPVRLPPGQHHCDGMPMAAIKGELISSNRRQSREFNREVSLPAAVNLDKLASRLAYDGLLTVEAPLHIIDEQLGPMTSSTRCPTKTPPQLSHQLSPNLLAPHQEHSAMTSSQFDASENTYLRPLSPATAQAVAHGPPIGATQAYDVIEMDNHRLLKLTVDLGSKEFLPQDVRVTVHSDRRLAVQAHFETASTATGKTTRRQFSREFDINETIDRSTVRASLDVTSGELLIMAASQRVLEMSRMSTSSITVQNAVDKALVLVGGISGRMRPCAVEIP